MTELNQVYKCNVCGNIVETVHAGGGTLVCCNQPMQLLTENTVDAAHEKHVPIIEKIPTGYKVRIGEIAHPMEEGHYIEFIELLAQGRSYKKFLNPGDKPETTFDTNEDKVTIRAYCNLHGLWSAQN
ncbi:desulfoferrodoxin [Candidatus Woesearchaeota archaeon]|nr:desulfoferrodoxin [Candidatus Woesearchaeota archaeon]